MLGPLALRYRDQKMNENPEIFEVIFTNAELETRKKIFVEQTLIFVVWYSFQVKFQKSNQKKTFIGMELSNF